MKKFAIILILVVLIVTGCHVERKVFKGSVVEKDKRFEMAYTLFNGEQKALVQFDAGDNLSVEIVNTTGSVDMAFSLVGGEIVYSGMDQKNASFGIIVPKEGTYEVSVTGHQAEGKIYIKTVR